MGHGLAHPGGAVRRARPRVEFPNRATRRDPPARGPQRLPAAAGGQGRGRRRPGAHLERVPDTRRRVHGSPRPPRAGARVAGPRRGHRGLDPAAARRPRRARGSGGRPPGVGCRPLGDHLALVGRRAGPPDRRGGGGPRRPVRLARPSRSPDDDPGTPGGRLGSPDRGGRRRPAVLDPRRRPADPGGVHHRDQRQVDGHPADHPHPAAGRAPRRDDDQRRDPRGRAHGRCRGLDRTGRRGGDPAQGRRGRRGPGDGARRPRPAGHGLRVQRGERVHQRLRGPPRSRRASTRSRSSRRSRRRCAASRSPAAWSCSTPTTPSWRASRGAFVRAWRTSRWTRARRRSSRATGGRAGSPGCWTGAGWSSGTAPDAHALLDVADLPVALGGLARHNVANALGGGRRGACAGRDAGAGGRRPARLPPVGRAVAGPAQPVPARPPDDHRGLRAQRGRHGGDPRRRDGDRRRGGGTGRARDRDHRDRRRPAGRHAARDRADRRGAGAAGRDQGDPRLPARTRPRGDHPGHRRRAGGGRPGPRDDPGLRERGRRPRVGAGRFGQRRRPAAVPMRRGSSCCSATRIATRSSRCSSAWGRTGWTSRRSLATWRPDSRTGSAAGSSGGPRGGPAAPGSRLRPGPPGSRSAGRTIRRRTRTLGPLGATRRVPRNRDDRNWSPRGRFVAGGRQVGRRGGPGGAGTARAWPPGGPGGPARPWAARRCQPRRPVARPPTSYPRSSSSASAAAGPARFDRFARTTSRIPASGYQRTWATYPGSPPGCPTQRRRPSPDTHQARP